MKHSEFWQLMNDEFGRSYARSVATDQQLSALDSMTPADALNAGIPVKQVWAAVCDAMDVPPERRFGREAPKRR